MEDKGNKAVKGTKSMIREASQEIVMSYVLAASERSLNKYAERLLIQLVALAQDDIEDMEFKSGLDLRPHTPNFDFAKYETVTSVVVSLPVASLRADGENVKTQFIIESLQQLQTQIVCWNQYKTDRDGNPVLNKKGEYIRQMVSVQMLGKVVMDYELNGYIEVTVDKDIWRAMEDFSKGFRAIDMTIVRRLKNKNSLRFYQLMARQNRPITYNEARLRGILGLGDKYERLRDLIKNVIEPAKKELDKVSPYTFEYILNRDESIGTAVKTGVKAISSITFIPIHQVEKDTVRTYNCDKQFVFLDREVNILLKEMGFSSRQVNNNIELFALAYENFGKKDGKPDGTVTFAQFLRELHSKRAIARNYVGYVVNSVKIHLKETYGITYKSKQQLKKEQEAEKIIMQNNHMSKNVDEPEITSMGDILGNMF